MNKIAILLTTKIRQRRGIAVKDVQEKSYIFDATTAKIYSLNETASFIWKNVRKPISIKTLTQQLQDEFEVDKPRAIKDVKAFINNFINLKFLEIVSN